MNKKIIVEDGIKFRKGSDGYYMNRKYGRYHRYIWEKAYGKIPEGYIIHHIDYKTNGRSNNSLDNLKCMSDKDHKILHSTERKITEETRAKMSASGRVKIFTEETRKNMSKAQLGRKHSEEAKQKIGDANRGRKASEKQRLSKAKSVKCVETDLIYDSLSSAQRAYNLRNSSGICACCKGTRNTAGGVHWEYV